MHEKKNLLRIFKETKKALEIGDSAKIKKLSNQTINSASFTQDPDNIAVAVIVYSLSKILSRENYFSFQGWDKFYSEYVLTISKIIKSLEEDNEKKFRQNIRHIRKVIDKLSDDLKKNIQDVFRKASINKASRIYEHGISMEKTANLLGISIWELANYSGGKDFPQFEFDENIDTESRIKLAMNLFR